MPGGNGKRRRAEEGKAERGKRSIEGRRCVVRPDREEKGKTGQQRGSRKLSKLGGFSLKKDQLPNLSLELGLPDSFPCEG